MRCYDADIFPESRGLNLGIMARPRIKNESPSISRRAILKGMAMTPVLLRAAPLFGSPAGCLCDRARMACSSPIFALFLIIPPQSPLADVLRLVAPGSDGYITEKYAVEIESILQEWSGDLRRSPHNDCRARCVRSIQRFAGFTLTPSDECSLRSAYGIRRDQAPVRARARLGDANASSRAIAKLARAGSRDRNRGI